MGDFPRKEGLVEMVKRKLKKGGYQSYYPAGLADCEESYKCLSRLNTTILIKINGCLTHLFGK